MAHKAKGVDMINICDKLCEDINYVGYLTKKTEYDEKIKIVLISECMPIDINEYYNKKADNAFITNTNVLFKTHGINLRSFVDYLGMGIYLTTALKCSKKSYLVSSKTIENCSYVLESELKRFPNVKVFLLMGDFAIKSMNYIMKRNTKKKIIPSGSTYKLRDADYLNEGILYIPSYTQTGDSFGIEKSKIKMMEEDIGKALKFIKK
jgi:uracil-DNA glycosylase